MTSQRFLNNSSSKFDFTMSLRSMIAPAIALVVTMIYQIYLSVENIISYCSVTWSSQGAGGRKTYNLFGSQVISKSGGAFFGDQTGVEFAVACFLLIGFLFAVAAFVPFMSKKSANFYYSIPVNRAKLFKNRVASAILLMLGITFVSVLFITICNMLVTASMQLLFKMAFAYFLGSVAYMLVSFAIFTFAFSICSTIIESITFGVGLVALPSIVVCFVDAILYGFLKTYNRLISITYLLKTYYSSGFEGKALLRETTIINPLFFEANLKTKELTDNLISSAYCDLYGSNTIPDINEYLPVIIWLILSIAIITLAKKIFINKKVENIAMHGSNTKINIFVALEFALGCVAATSISVYGDKLTRITGIIAIFVVSFLVFLFASTRKIKGNKKGMVAGCVTLAIIIAFSGVSSLGLFGYNNYVPEAKDVEMVAISSNVVSIDGAVQLDVNNSYYCNGWAENSGIGIFTDEDDIKQALDVVKLCTEKSNSERFSYIKVDYVLKNGKKISRKYEYVTPEARESLFKLTDTKIFKDNIETLFTGKVEKRRADASFDRLLNKYDYNGYAFNGALLSCEYLTASYTNLAQLEAYACKIGSKSVEIENNAVFRKALAEDLINTTYKQRYFSDELPVCFVGFSYAYDEVYYGDEFSYEANLAGYYIYPSMTNTIEYLNSNGVLDKIEEFDAVKSINKAYITPVKSVDAAELLIVGGSLTYFFEGDYGETLLSPIKYAEKEITNLDEIKKLASTSKPLAYTKESDKLLVVECTSEQDETVYISFVLNQ